jgi:neurotransmitter:Na+ symporter, NSS family
MYAELSIGSRGGSDPIGSLLKLSKHNKYGIYISYITGILAVIATIIILSFYSVIAGWSINFFILSINSYSGGVTEIKSTLNNLYTANNGIFLNISLLYHTIFMFITIFIVAMGIEKGIEIACKILMPILMLLLLIIMIIGLNMEGKIELNLSFPFLSFPFRSCLK